MSSRVVYCFFFFQAEDGIRDVAVTGVQTCALPILHSEAPDTTIRLTRRSSGAAEGYEILVKGGTVSIAGNDARGVLFGVGRLLRALHMEKGAVTIDDVWSESSAPKYALRGHQLGYRPKTNSYDGWTVSLWEQYIRDLAVFGTNDIELIPPRSDDAA